MGRAPTIQSRQNRAQIKHIWDKHHEIKRLTLLGRSAKEIASELGCASGTVQNIQAGELFQRELAAARVARDSAAMDVAKAIEEEGPRCLKVLTAIRDNRVDIVGEVAPISLRAHVAMDLLDRSAKTAKVKQIQGDLRHAHIVGVTTLEKLKERARSVTDALMGIETEVQNA